MKTRYIIFAFAMLAVSACAKESVQEHRVTITAWQEAVPQTKTAVQDGGRQVYWEPGDAIKVFIDGDGSRFESQCSSLSTVSDFVGTMTVIGGGNEGADMDKYIWGLYPYRVDATSDGESVTTTFPSSQTAREGSFASETFITLARSESFGLAFYNVCGGIRFTLSQEGIRRVVLKGNNDEPLAGTFTATFEDGVPVVTGISDPKSKITLKAPDGGAFQTGVWYYITVLPGTLQNGFKLTFRTDSETGTVSSSNSVRIKRGIFGSLADVDAGAEFAPGGGGDPEDIDIEIDGDFLDWADVTTGLKSTSSSPKYIEFKVHNDNNYIYFYSKRNNNTAIWNTDGSQGYFYYDLDTDNNSSTGTTKDNISGLETWMYIMPFAGTPTNPQWATTLNGSSYPSSSVYKSVIYAGAYDSETVEIELRLPLSVAGVNQGDVIGIYSWGNKSASDFKTKKLVYTVK